MNFAFSKRLICLAIASAVSISTWAAPVSNYSEPFRPQYHFTPPKNWMNDPNGLLFYEGEYHLFYQHNPFGDKWGHMSWGHAVSRDLVHWQHLPIALPEENGVMIFSGSAVVDWKNTSGFGTNGKPPMVAIYTGFRPSDGMQFQCIAYSNDKGRTWTKFSGNPVIDIGSKDFRDPKVQWHRPTQQWVMTVSLAAERKVRFYGSRNLKQWKLLSEFGPAGATEGAWECPDLFELPVHGTREKRWVLTVNTSAGNPAGGSGGQYFVGQFDGTNFVADKNSTSKNDEEFVPQGTVIADFEGNDYGAWKLSGDAFGSSPATGTLANQNPVTGFKGHRLVNTYLKGDQTTGTLTSPKFDVTQPFLNFLIGGGAQKSTRMDLLVNGKVVRTASGSDSEHLQWRSWDVREFAGRKAGLQIVDEATGGWGHINIDQIMLANQPARSAAKPGLWFDYGKDCYATVSWSDVPKSDGRRLWIGWMTSIEYPQNVPTSPWRSAMTIPREVYIRKTAEGIRVIQKPVRELAKLRDKHFVYKGGDMSAANSWLTKQQIAGDCLEILVEFDCAKSPSQGLKLCKGPTDETIVGVDYACSRVFIDRRKSGNVGFNPQFPGVHYAPIVPRTSKVKLHVFVDACSVEVFINDGESVITDLIFPSPNSRGVEFFSPNPDAKIVSAEIWTLRSAWK